MGAGDGGRGAGNGRRLHHRALVPPLLAAALLTASATIVLSADPAPADKPAEARTGRIVLEIVEASPEARPSSPAQQPQVVRVAALDRSLPQKMIDKEVRVREIPAKPVEGQPGKWAIEDIAPGSWDLLVETKAGRFEGYALRPAEKSDEAFTDEDRGKIREIFDGIKTYEDEKRILDLGGNGRAAVALVELIRRGETTLKPGVVTWRVEYWRFEKLYGVWRRDDPKALRRALADSKEFAGWNWNFVPELGAAEVRAGETCVLKWSLPAKFDPARGRAAGPGGDALRQGAGEGEGAEERRGS